MTATAIVNPYPPSTKLVPVPTPSQIGALGLAPSVLGAALAPAALAADQNDYGPTGIATANTISLSSSLAVSITGISASQSAGQLLYILNSGSFDITFVNGSGLSSANNRFAMGANFVLHANQGALFRYNGVALRWNLISRATIAASDITAMTASRAVASDVSGFITPSATTSAELGYLSGATSNIQTQISTKQDGAIPVAVTFATPLPTDASLGNIFRTTVSSSFTLQNPTNPTDAQTISWEFKHDANVGLYVITLDTKWNAGAVSVVLPSTVNGTSILNARYNQAADKWWITSFLTGY